MADGGVSLRTLLRLPEVAHTLTASMVGRLALTSIGLLLILRVRDLGGSYADGGLVVGAFSLALALCAPVVGRQADLRGQTVVLAGCALVSSLPLAAIALLPDGAPIPAVAALAALAGLAHPPLGGCMRALWPTLVPDPALRHAAFALEASALELTFVVGPLILVGALAAQATVAIGLLACGAVLLGGTLAFAASPASRSWRPDRAAAGRSPAGALASPALLVFLAAAVFMGAAFGAIELATTAFAEERDQLGLVGPLLAVWAFGSMIGGLVSARRGAPREPWRELALLLAATAVANGLLGAAPAAWALAPALALAGFCIAPAFATLYGMVAGLARAGTLTESYTWLATGIFLGAAAGSAAAGALVELTSARVGLSASGLAAAVAAAIVATGRERFRIRRDPGPVGGRVGAPG